jgi:membrane-associated HD superfamily phosphohydrolase
MCQVTLSHCRIKKIKISKSLSRCHTVTQKDAKCPNRIFDSKRPTVTPKRPKILKMQKLLNSYMNKYWYNSDTMWHCTVWRIWWTSKKRTKARYGHILVLFLLRTFSFLISHFINYCTIVYYCTIHFFFYCTTVLFLLLHHCICFCQITRQFIFFIFLYFMTTNCFDFLFILMVLARCGNKNYEINFISAVPTWSLGLRTIQFLLVFDRPLLNGQIRSRVRKRPFSKWMN